MTSSKAILHLAVLLGILGIAGVFPACGTKAPSPALESAEKKEPEVTDTPDRFIHMHLEQMPDFNGTGGLGIFSVPQDHGNNAPPAINSPERFLKEAPQRSRYKLQD